MTNRSGLTGLDQAVRNHLRLLPDDTENLDALIYAAWEYVENFTGHAYGTDTVKVYVDNAQYVELPRTPAVSITSITADGEAVTDYTFNAASGSVVFSKELSNIEIIYTAGDGTCPFVVWQALLMLIAHWYSNREAVVVGAIATVEPSIGVKELLRQEKGWWF